VERELVENFAPREVEELNRLFAALIAKAEAHSYHPKLRRLGRSAAAAKAARPAPKPRTRRRTAARG